MVYFSRSMRSTLAARRQNEKKKKNKVISFFSFSICCLFFSCPSLRELSGGAKGFFISFRRLLVHTDMR